MRRSPIRHQVKTYRKGTTVVQSYVRGHGQRMSRMANPTLRLRTIRDMKPEGYSVHFKFSDKAGDTEVKKVISTTYKGALDKAFELKEDPREPVEIHIIDPNLHEVFSAIGDKAKVLAQSAVKYGKVVGKASAGVAGEFLGDVRAAGLQQVAKRGDFIGGMAQRRLNTLSEKFSDKQLESLVKQSYSPNKEKRRIAIIKLREKYPSVYHEMDLETQNQHITVTHIQKTSPKSKKKVQSRKNMEFQLAKDYAEKARQVEKKYGAKS